MTIATDAQRSADERSRVACEDGLLILVFGVI